MMHMNMKQPVTYSLSCYLKVEHCCVFLVWIIEYQIDEYHMYLDVGVSELLVCPLNVANKMVFRFRSRLFYSKL